MTRFWTIWTSFVAISIVSIVLFQLGAVEFLIENDFTYISFVNLTILYIFNLVIVWKAYDPDYRSVDLQWFWADAVLSLGMLGTLAGFLMVLYSTFQGLDVSDTESMKAAIETLATGMGTALITSLVGLASSIVMKFQLVTLDSGDS